MGAVEAGLLDYSATANLYSQLAGVLAGFAFAGLIALIVAQLSSDVSVSYALQSYRPLIAAFIALVGTSLDYGIIAGDRPATARSAALETTAGIGFSVAGSALLHSIFILLRGVEADAVDTKLGGKIASLLGHTIVFGASPLVIYLLYSGVQDQEFIKYGRGFHGLDLAAILLMCGNVAYGTTVTLLKRLGRLDRARDAIGLLSVMTIAIALFSIVCSVFIVNSINSDTKLPDYIALIEMIVLTTFTLVVSYSTVTYSVTPSSATSRHHATNRDRMNPANVRYTNQGVAATVLPNAQPDAGADYRFLIAILAGVALGSAIPALQTIVQRNPYDTVSITASIQFVTGISCILLVYLAVVRTSPLVIGQVDLFEVGPLFAVALAECALFVSLAVGLDPGFILRWFVSFTLFCMLAIITLMRISRKVASMQQGPRGSSLLDEFRRSLHIDCVSAASTGSLTGAYAFVTPIR